MLLQRKKGKVKRAYSAAPITSSPPNTAGNVAQAIEAAGQPKTTYEERMCVTVLL